jgi:hypothetical protein
MESKKGVLAKALGGLVEDMWRAGYDIRFAGHCFYGYDHFYSATNR